MLWDNKTCVKENYCITKFKRAITLPRNRENKIESHPNVNSPMLLSKVIPCLETELVCTPSRNRKFPKRCDKTIFTIVINKQHCDVSASARLLVWQRRYKNTAAGDIRCVHMYIKFQRKQDVIFERTLCSEGIWPWYCCFQMTTSLTDELKQRRRMKRLLGQIYRNGWQQGIRQK